MRFLMVTLALAFSIPGSTAEVTHFASNEQGFAVNSWVVPTASGVIVIDTQFTVADADGLLQTIAQTRLPLRAIIVTHAHPDHYNGTCQLLGLAPVPVYATQSTIDGIRATAAGKRTQWKPTYGTNYPDRTCVPDHAVPSGARVRIDGLELQFRDYGPGEALAESVVLAPALHAAFVGDLIYDQVHPWLAEGRSAQWLGQLDRLSKDLPAGWIVYPGHGAAGSASVIKAQRRYITEFRAAVQAQLGPGGLSPDGTGRVVASTRAQYPGWSLEMLIPINAEAIANEITRDPLR